MLRIVAFLALLLALPYLSLPSQAQGIDPLKRFEGLYMNSSGDPLLGIIRAARVSLDIEIYEMTDPLILNALIAAKDRGVAVRIVQDGSPFESGCKIFTPPSRSDSPTCIRAKQFVAAMRQRGAPYLPYNKAALCILPKPGYACFEHGKVLIADRQIALFSTGNFNDENLCDNTDLHLTCNRDYTAVTSDRSIVATLGRIFQKDLEGFAYDLKAVLLQGGVARKITVSPLSRAPLQEFIESAQQSLVVQNQYLDDESMNQALIAAARRGVRVYVNTSSACAFGPPGEEDKRNYTAVYAPFDAAGIRTSMFTDQILVGNPTVGMHPGYLHAKAIVVDDKRAWVGSVNGSGAALDVNREFGLFVADPEVALRLSRQILGDMLHPSAETWQESLFCKKD